MLDVSSLELAGSIWFGAQGVGGANSTAVNIAVAANVSVLAEALVYGSGGVAVLWADRRTRAQQGSCIQAKGGLLAGAGGECLAIDCASQILSAHLNSRY